MTRFFLTLMLLLVGSNASTVAVDAPYPPSQVIESITWHWETHRTAAPGSDLWPIAWASDGHLYTAWGDGGGFGGTNSDGRVSMGFGRIEGSPERFKGVNVNGGKTPEHAASFPTKGKAGGITCVDGKLYAWMNMQDGTWPGVNLVLICSDDLGATWNATKCVFPKGRGNLKPVRFVNHGKDYNGVPEQLKGYVYSLAFREESGGEGKDIFLLRAPRARMADLAAYEFFNSIKDDGKPVWSKESREAEPVFKDGNGVILAGITYHPVLKRYLLMSYHSGPGQLGIFDAPDPWGPWTTVAYNEDWGKMEAGGHGLNFDFPAKWMSDDGLSMWGVFSVYGAGAQKGINAHDKFNIVKVSVKLRAE